MSHCSCGYEHRVDSCICGIAGCVNWSDAYHYKSPFVLDDADEVEIVFTIRRSLWGQGLASEITPALIDLGLSRLRLPSLVGVVSGGNTASRRVLEKSGFTLERTGQYHGDGVVIYRHQRTAAIRNDVQPLR